MLRYFIQLSYCGAAYHGWQIQPHDNSVQETLEQALSVLLRTKVNVVGAGRTDTGVNARMMVAHIDVEAPIAIVSRFVHSLNGMLPRDIAIERVWPVPDGSHARFDAMSRTYKYFIHTTKSPFLYDKSWYTRPGLDFAAMNEAAACLLRHIDFTSFSKLHTDVKTNNCRVTRAEWTPLPVEGCHVFTITADRFLRNMVRAVVGTLVEVGRHKIDVAQFERIIEARNRNVAGTSMPGHALYLWEITYPDAITSGIEVLDGGLGEGFAVDVP